MSKIGRNDTCPCGSGKKFKKCCGKNNVINFNTTLYRNEIDHLYEDLIEFAFGQFEQEIFEIVKHFIDEYYPTIDEDYIDMYSELVSSWAIFTVPMKEGQTLFDLFYQKEKNKIKYPAVRSLLATWSSAPAGIFEVFSTEDHVELRDLSTDERYTIPLNAEHNYEQGNLAIGTLIPFTDTYEFFISMIQLPGKHLQAITHLIDENLQENVLMREIFPQFLADFFQLETNPAIEMNQFDWNHVSHKMAAQLFQVHATDKGYDEKLIHMTIQYWSDYCKLRRPIVRKPAAHAAALDYFSHREFLVFTDVTQTELAKEYGTSAGTISNHYGNLSDDFDYIMDMLKSGAPSPPAHNMEKHMRDLTRMLGEQEFESEDELNDFLQVAMNLDDVSPSKEPRDIAQDLLFDAREASGAKRKKLIQEALTVYPLSPDIYLLMAEDERDMDKRMELLEKAIDVGEQDLGEAFFDENMEHFWGIIETRPYMRAKATYAMHLENIGFIEEAMQEYMDLLELNPNDNQGIRYLLLPLFMEVGDFEAAHALMDQYDESTASFVFSKALLHYEENGITKDGIKLLKEATNSNPYVIDYLLRRKKLPEKDLDYVGIGDETEAIAYVQRNDHLWFDAV